MRVTGNRKACVGAGQCVLAVPEVFDQDDDGLVVVLQEELGEDWREAVQEAADTCPSQAVRVFPAW